MRTAVLRAFRALGKGAKLTAPERRVLLLAWLAAPLVTSSLRAVGLKGTRWWLSASARAGARLLPGPLALPDVPRAAELVAVAYRYHWVGGECLPRALTQAWLHGLAGQSVRLCIGVAPQGERLAAHAWVEPADTTRPAGAIDLVPLRAAA
ncbi:MAG: lasso peptide biosynthesis B2 protein [Myxococcales bacterium]|nr:lasso peptide biosynthesis B2 protein [Myxococcales bacterium]